MAVNTGAISGAVQGYLGSPSLGGGGLGGGGGGGTDPALMAALGQLLSGRRGGRQGGPVQGGMGGLDFYVEPTFRTRTTSSAELPGHASGNVIFMPGVPFKRDPRAGLMEAWGDLWANTISVLRNAYETYGYMGGGGMGGGGGGLSFSKASPNDYAMSNPSASVF